MPKLIKKYEAFSLIEILIVVALIIILATITIVAINPGKNFEDTRNAQRSSDVAAILNAVTQYTSEEGNSLSALDDAVTGTIPQCDVAGAEYGAEIGNGTDMVDLTGEPLVEDYIVEMPLDPTDGVEDEDTGTIETGYFICQTDGGRTQISAPAAIADGRDEAIIVKR